MSEAPHLITCICTPCEVAREKHYYERLLVARDAKIAELEKELETVRKRVSRLQNRVAGVSRSGA